MFKNIKNFVLEVFDVIKKEEMSILPGNLAYSFFLSIIPILTLAVYFISAINLSTDSVNSFFYKIFPSSVADLLHPILTSEMTLQTFIPLCISVFVVTNGCKTIINTSNTIFGCKRSSYIKRMLKSSMLVVMLIILFGFMFIVPLLGKVIIDFLINASGNNIVGNSTLDLFYFILRVPVSAFFMFLMIKVIYVVAPDDKIPFKFVNRGSLFTTITWLIVTLIFSYYINNIANYNLVYGNLANIVMLLFWFYILAFIFVIGLYLNRINIKAQIDKTNTIKLDEIRKKVLESK